MAEHSSPRYEPYVLIVWIVHYMQLSAEMRKGPWRVSGVWVLEAFRISLDPAMGGTFMKITFSSNQRLSKLQDPFGKSPEPGPPSSCDLTVVRHPLRVKTALFHVLSAVTTFLAVTTTN